MMRKTKLKLNHLIRRKICTLTALSSLFTTVSQANVIGTDTQNFNPTTSGLDFVTVHSSETLEPGFVNFGLFLNHAINTLPYFESSDSSVQSRNQYNDAILGMDLNVGVGLLPNWDIGLSLPQILFQEVKNNGIHGQFKDKGNTEIRLNSKYRLWGTRSYGVAVVGSTNINRLANNPFIGKDPGPTYNLELAADTTIKNIALGMNLGHRWRQSGEKLDPASPIEPMKNQYIGSVAASYLFASIDTKLIFEIFGSSPVEKTEINSDRLLSSAEALLGLKHDFNNTLAGHFGGGTELNHGLSSPDWRIYAGVNWSIGPTFSKPQNPVKVVKNVPVQIIKSDEDPFSGVPESEERVIVYNILFEYDSDHMVLPGATKTLERLVDYIKKPPAFTKLIIEGHTDSVGSRQYNTDLSRRRAETIRKWLVQRFKLNPNSITAQGKGEDEPIADNGNYQGRQLNRRVEFRIFRDKR